MRKGKPLKKGDLIGLVGPSSAVREPDALAQAVSAIEAAGYRVKKGRSFGQRYGYFSGDDETRAADINEMFADDRVDMILCIRGGYGTPRILDRLDYDAIARHPKIFMGYSDITGLHQALYQNSGLVTFHGPMAMDEWMRADEENPFTMTSAMRALTDRAPLGEIVNPPQAEPIRVMQAGRAEGPLVGGNLSLIAGFCGTPYDLDVKGKILLLEDVGEKTYRIDHMLSQLRLAGKFDDCAGVLLGGFTNCPVEYPGFGLEIDEVIRDVILPSGKPVLAGFLIGHTARKITVPLGVMSVLDADRGTFTITESALA